jgi:3,4-dihydroxy 2-butanone 4-phosphate synthase
MNQSLLDQFGTSEERVKRALAALQQGSGVIVTDDEDRENEGDMIFSSEHLTSVQMALLIRECSGIVCLCMTDDKIKQLDENHSQFQTAFTVSIEAAEGVTTGVSAADRVRTVKAASCGSADSSVLNSPGHVFPLRAREGGVLERRGHTEATVDLMRLSGLGNCGVLCEVTNPDGTMARMPELVEISKKYEMPMLTIEDLVAYRKENSL